MKLKDFPRTEWAIDPTDPRSEWFIEQSEAVVSDDIVIRLRNADAPRDGSELLCDLADEAADEIERLRREESETFIHYRKTISELNEVEADRDRLRELLDDFAHHLQGYLCQCRMSKCKCGYDDLMYEYKEVRGE